MEPRASPLLRRSKPGLALLLCLGACLLLSVTVLPQQAPVAPGAQPGPLRVLFVGNSLTYFNDMPLLLERLALGARGSRPIIAEMAVIPGTTLEYHWERGRARERIQRERWDYVVLQEQGARPLYDREQMFAYARRFDAEIKKRGARTIFFLTWARASRAGDQNDLNTAYTEIARELGAGIAPVGVAWQRALRQNPALRLHAPDGSHPNLLGSYLAACVFWATFSGKSPVGLPSLGLEPAQARLLQEVAWETVISFRTDTRGE